MCLSKWIERVSRRRIGCNQVLAKLAEARARATLEDDEPVFEPFVQRAGPCRGDQRTDARRPEADDRTAEHAAPMKVAEAFTRRPPTATGSA